MDRDFDAEAFVRRIGERLVDEFRNAKAGTSPGTVGSAAEQPVREQLAQVIPRGVGVGQGFVIDSGGTTSRQQDVVLFEREICPVFSVNNTPATTYYPCEGVIAVGEVKSSLDGTSLRDAFEKVASVKRVRRYEMHEEVPHPTTGVPIPRRRNYLTRREGSIVQLDEDASAEGRERMQVFGFVLAGECRLKGETLAERFRELAAEHGDDLCPNLLLTLDGCFVRWASLKRGKRNEVGQSDDGTFTLKVFRDGSPRWEPSWSAVAGTHLICTEETEPFRQLLRWLRMIVQEGRTSAVESFERYFETASSAEQEWLVSLPKLRTT
ncbi:MAG: hypothetical protein OXK76_01550 [Gammaproteobacteria bacterium]|nr:hypothetical protein [Gammaproteobacteria bacterium]